jgi:hypothetical protein
LAGSLGLSRLVGKRKPAKRLPPSRNGLSFLPNRVRHDEIEQSAFFGSLLLFEQPVHVSREFEQADTSIHVLPVSGPESVDFSLNARLLLPVFTRLSFEYLVGRSDFEYRPAALGRRPTTFIGAALT